MRTTLQSILVFGWRNVGILSTDCALESTPPLIQDVLHTSPEAKNVCCNVFLCRVSASETLVLSSPPPTPHICSSGLPTFRRHLVTAYHLVR